MECVSRCCCTLSPCAATASEVMIYGGIEMCMLLFHYYYYKTIFVNIQFAVSLQQTENCLNFNTVLKLK